VDPTRIGVMGGSRGGELALLLGSTYPDLKAVVATVPSGLVWGAAVAAKPLPSAWTQGGPDLPFVPESGAMPTVTTDASGQQIYVEAPMFLGDLKAATADALEAATIRVEKTNGPVLLLAGADDQLWASCTLAAVAFDRLKSTGHQATHADDFQCYPETGHSLLAPGIPTTGLDQYYLAEYKIWMAMGGKPAGAARAARESDTRIRRFLEKSLGSKP
jgi:dienelactone hydrolase